MERVRSEHLYEDRGNKASSYMASYLVQHLSEYVIRFFFGKTYWPIETTAAGITAELDISKNANKQYVQYFSEASFVWLSPRAL